ncbi:MAG: FlgD immunoglobulin-like domain containing protein [Candidatus Eisenbacteria bacterium]
MRIDPNPTAYQPGDDTTPAPGVNAWITGQNSSEGVDDVDNGVAASRSSVIDLSAHPHVRLDLNYFFGQRDPGDDPSGDFFKLSVSNNGGSTFPVDLLSIGDVVNPAAWTSLTVELDGVIPITSQMVFRVQAADGIATGDIIEGGLDDFLLSDRGDGNDPPSIPVLSSPSDGAGDQPGNLALTVTNSTDPENDVLAYGFRVYGDADLTQLLRSVDGVASGPSTTAWPVSPSLPVGTYYWRAFANDGHSLGLCMNPARFTVGAATAVGDAGAPRAALAAGPNPSRDDVLIRYFATQAPTARLDVFDAMGRRVRTLPSAKWTVGWQEVRWDGKDDAGRRVAAGIYQVRLATPGETRSVRVVRLQ